MGSGGHTAEMLQLVRSLMDNEGSRIQYRPRIYYVSDTDVLSETKIWQLEGNDAVSSAHPI